MPREEHEMGFCALECQRDDSIVCEWHAVHREFVGEHDIEQMARCLVSTVLVVLDPYGGHAMAFLPRNQETVDIPDFFRKPELCISNDGYIDTRLVCGCKQPFRQFVPTVLPAASQLRVQAQQE